jgi:hypothetical protein
MKIRKSDVPPKRRSPKETRRRLNYMRLERIIRANHEGMLKGESIATATYCWAIEQENKLLGVLEFADTKCESRPAAPPPLPRVQEFPPGFKNLATVVTDVVKDEGVGWTHLLAAAQRGLAKELKERGVTVPFSSRYDSFANPSIDLNFEAEDRFSDRYFQGPRKN